MDQLQISGGFPLLSLLIFLPLAGGAVLLFVRGEQFARLWALGVTTLTALAFCLLKRFIEPVDRICVDIDWLYRMAGRGFLWLVRRPLQWCDTAWGEAYRVVGLHSLMTISRFWSWFDWHAIDGVVDGLARSVRALGGRVRLLQSGQIQMTLFTAFSLAAIVLVTYIFFQLS